MFSNTVLNIAICLLLIGGVFWAKQTPKVRRHWSAAWFLNSVKTGLVFGALYLMLVISDLVGAWDGLGSDKGTAFMIIGIPLIIAGVVCIVSAIFALVAMSINWTISLANNSVANAESEGDQ